MVKDETAIRKVPSQYNRLFEKVVPGSLLYTLDFTHEAKTRMTYILQSERLGFRAWSEADIDLANDLWGDVEVTRLIGGPFSKAQVQERLSREIATMQHHNVQYWPIFLLSNGAHVGCCGLRPYKIDQKIYELGVHLKKRYWGQGYAAEAAQTVITYAFKTFGVNALFAGHNPANVASRSLLQKLGFRYTHDEYYAPTGLKHPSYLLTAQDFNRSMS